MLAYGVGTGFAVRLRALVSDRDGALITGSGCIGMHIAYSPESVVLKHSASNLMRIIVSLPRNQDITIVGSNIDSVNK
ncbi:unnamed protein product, partial [Umbelopsis ramanniana]